MIDRAAIEAKERSEHPTYVVREKDRGRPAFEVVVNPEEFPDWHEEIVQRRVDILVEIAEKERAELARAAAVKADADAIQVYLDDLDRGRTPSPTREREYHKAMARSRLRDIGR